MKTTATLFFAVAARAAIGPMPAHTVRPFTTAQQPPAQPTFEMRELNEAEEAALPQGEGRDAVAFMCVPCHGVLTAISVRKTSSDTSTSRSSRNVFFSRSSTIKERTDIYGRLLVGRIAV